jgi:hypothetical protein
MGLWDTFNRKKGAKIIIYLFIIGKGVNGLTRIH